MTHESEFTPPEGPPTQPYEEVSERLRAALSSARRRRDTSRGTDGPDWDLAVGLITAALMTLPEVDESTVHESCRTEIDAAIEALEGIASEARRPEHLLDLAYLREASRAVRVAEAAGLV